MTFIVSFIYVYYQCHSIKRHIDLIGQILNYNFEWDPSKARKNIKKHRISFERASEIFLDPYALSIFDKEHSADEDRWITIGKTKSENIIIVIHTFQSTDKENIRIRIISARKATRNERKQYKGT